MEPKKLLSMHRIQAETMPALYKMQNAPVKRVIISACGKIEFNPDERQFIYFSKTNTHHIYYIFNKVIKIILDELHKSNQLDAYKKLKLPDQIMPYYLYSQTHINVIKAVKDFFKNYLPENCVELVTLNYLQSFSDFFLRASINNKKKNISNLPEVSDTNTFGGALGVNDAWLNLLKACTVSSSQAKLNLDNFFDFLLDNSYRGAICRTTLKQVLSKNPEFFTILDIVTYTQLQNPEFYDKNNINKMKSAVTEIEKRKLYNPNSNLTKQEFKNIKKQLKQEIIDIRDH